MLLNSEKKISLLETERSHEDGQFKKTSPPEFGLDHLETKYQSLDPNKAKSFQIITQNSIEFYQHSPIKNYDYNNNQLSFESNTQTMIKENNKVYGDFFSSRNKKRAIILLPNWNAKRQSINKFASALSLLGIPCLRLSMPYHDQRQPKDRQYAEYMVSPNIGRTITSIQQAVKDVRCTIDWLEYQGYESIGLIGISIGSCIATLVAAHDSRIKSLVQILMASNFTDVVMSGIATKHIQESFSGFIEHRDLKKMWHAISPDTYVENLAEKETRVKMITAKYDPVFLPRLAQEMNNLYLKYSVNAKWTEYHCGHYTLGSFPHNYRAFIETFFHLRSLKKVV